MESIQFVSVTPRELTDVITTKVTEVIGTELEKVLQKHLAVKKEKEFITRTEAAEILSLSISGLYKLMKKRKIQVKKVGRKPYFRRQDILNILEQKSAV